MLIFKMEFLLNTIYLKYMMMGIAFISIFIVSFMVYKKKYDSTEVVIQISVTFIIIFMAGLIAKASIPDLERYEFINGSVTKAVWEEAYSYIKIEHHSSGSGKTRKTWTTTRIVNVDDKFYVNSTAGKFNIDRNTFNTYINKFGYTTLPSPHSERLERDSGRIFESIPPVQSISTSFLHLYDNYISASKSVLHSRNTNLENSFMKVLPVYPTIHRDPTYGVDRIYERIIDKEKILSPKKKQELETLIDDFQTKYASSKQCNIIFVLTKNTDYNYFLALKSYWKGANKNDIVIVMNDNLKFIDVITYTEATKFVTSITNAHYNYPTNLKTEELVGKQVVDSLESIKKFYVRLPMATFESFKSNIAIPIAVDLTLAIVLLISQTIMFIVFYKID